MSQEDDVLIRAMHLDYYSHWSEILESSGLLPAFNLYEHFSGFKSDSKYLLFMTSEPKYEQIMLFYFRHHLFLAPWKPTATITMLTRKHVQRVVSKPFWKEDVHIYAQYKNLTKIGETAPRLPEKNPYINQMWMYRISEALFDGIRTPHPVVPVIEFNTALVHHQSNKYTRVPLTHDSNSSHNYKVSADEYLSTYYSCLGETYPPRSCPGIMFDHGASAELKKKGCTRYFQSAPSGSWDINVTYKFPNNVPALLLMNEDVNSTKNLPLCKRCLLKDVDGNRMRHFVHGANLLWRNRDANFTEKHSTAEIGKMTCVEKIPAFYQ